MITVLSPQGVYRGNYVNNIPNATPYFDDKFTDNLETMQTTLEFAVPLQSEDSEWLEGFGTVLYPDKDNVLRELTIINVWEDWSQEQPLKRVVCEDSSVDALLKSHVVPFTAGNLRDAIAGALRTTPWEYIIGSDTINIGYELVDVKEYTDVRSTLENIRELYDIEYRFSVKFDGQRITRVLHVYKRFGSNTGKYFVYDRDLINIERTVDFDNIHTAILPYWMEQDVVRTLAGYSPINKINGFRKDNPMDIIIHEAAHNDYDQGGYAKVLIMKSSSTDPELTYLEACNKLLDYIAPTYTYTVNVLLLENALGFEGTEQIHLGDTVWLKEKVGDMELGLEARVIELVTSHNNPEDDQVTFTNFKEISTADSEDVLALRDMINQIQNQQDQINQVVVQVTEDITVLQQGQEGIIEQLGDVPSVSVGDTPTPNPKEGDIWFLDAVDPDTGKTYSTIRIWNETTGEWQDRYSAKDAEEAQAAANEAAQAGKDAQAAADAAKEAAQDAAAAGQAALDKANQAVTDAANAKAQADAIQVDVEGLQTDVGKAQTDASKALTDSASAITKVGQVDSKLTTVTNDVNGMKTTITDIETVQGETTQKLTEVETNVNGLTVTVGQVKTTADSALSKATTVETTVDGLKVTVGEVKTTADGAMAKATQVEATADGLKATITAVQEGILNSDYSNIIPNSKGDSTKGYVVWGGSNFSTDGTQIAVKKGTATTSYGIQTDYLVANVEKDTTYTLQLDVGSYYNTSALNYNFLMYEDGQGNQSIPNIPVFSGSATFYTRSITFKPVRSGRVKVLLAVSLNQSPTSTGFRIKNLMMFKGESSIRAWQPAYPDLATVAKVTQVEATVGGLKTTVSEVQTDMKQLSNRNLLSNTATLSNMTLGSNNGVVDPDNSFNGNATAKGVHAGSFTDTFSQPTINTPRDGKFTISFWAKADRTISFNNFFFSSGTTTNAVNSDGKTSTSADGRNDLVATTAWKKYWITYTNVNATAAKRIILGRTISACTLWINSPMLVEGAVPADWQPAPEDLATVTKVSQIEQTANGLKTTVAEIQTGIADLTNKFPDPDFQKQNPKPTPDGTISFSYQADGLLLNNTGAGTSRVYWTGESLGLVAGKTYNVKLFLNVGSSSVGKPFEIGFSSGENVKFAPTSTTNQWVQGTVKASIYAGFSIFVPPSSTIKIHEMYIYEANTDITSSQITQLADQINLKVDKNGVIAQINVSSEGVLIDGKYVHITGTTTIDNAVIKTSHIADLAVSNAKIANLAVNGAKIADASITTAKIGDLQVSTAKIANLAVTDAKIGSLSASKITTGTLDAGKISVINLSASSITSGTLSGLTIQSPYDRPITDGSTTWQRGTLTLSNGLYTNAWETYVKSTGVKNISGKLIIDHQALSSYQLDSSGQLEYNMQLSPYALTLQTKDGKGGSFSYNDLYSMPRTGLQPASGFEQYSTSSSSGQWPTATRMGRLVQLAGAFKNIDPLPASANVLQMGILPIWARPNQTTNVIAQGSGMNRYLLGIEPGGAINMSRYGSGSSYEQVGKGSWLNIATTYAGSDV